MAKNNITMLEQPPYSPHLNPVTLFSSLKFMGLLKGTHFQDSTTMKRVVTKEFSVIPEEFSQE